MTLVPGVLTKVSAMGATLTDPRTADQQWLREHGVRMPAKNEVNARHGLRKLYILAVADVGKGNQKITLRTKFLYLDTCGIEGRLPKVRACRPGCHPLRHHRNHHAKDSN